MPVHDERRPDDPDRLAAHDGAAHDGAPIGGAADHRGYARPRAFFVGPAAQMVRGGLYGKAHDGYTGYYMEP
jgi:hypothetical protein